ncbi:MAG: outer membrane beta-barrel protein [Tepidisphaeraceae bacterium]
MSWKGFTSTAALAVLACGSVAYASQDEQVESIGGSSQLVSPVFLDDATTAPATAPTTEAAPASAPAETTLTPVMYLLDPTAFGQWLEKYKFSVTGFVEGGYFIDTNNPRLGTGPHGDAPTLVTFAGPYSNRFLLDQADMTFSKGVDSTKSWDWGFLVEGGYGTDDSFIHSHGILDNRPPNNPQNQLDLVQANVSVLIPLGAGVTINAGKFVAFLGEEVINPTGNLFFTHSYSFFYGIPATNTGVETSYTFAKLINGNDWTASAGVTRGWNQSTWDNNGAIDFLGEVKGNLTSALSLVVNLEEGPEGTNDNADYWTTAELIPSYTITSSWTVSSDLLYSDFPHGAVTAVGETAQWYGAALYSNYKFNPMFAFNVRAEWYRDQGGFTTGTQANYYEATVGVQIHPLPNDNIFQYLQFRPEVRVDDADQRVFNLSSNAGRGEYSELTAAVDVIMQF